MNPYKESMLRLVSYVGLAEYGSTRPPTTEKEALYFYPSESLEWKKYLYSLPKNERHSESVRRRLATRIWYASQSNLCLWCWVPNVMCICDQIERYRAQILSEKLNDVVKVTIIMHAEELMRGTNSGHIAAFILGAPICVWGVTEDNNFLQNLPAISIDKKNNTTNNNNNSNSYAVSLYPEEGATLVENFVQSIKPGNKVHLLLSDGTWGQATALNRHIPRHIPRVALNINKSYNSLFKALRKQTRETGVSTLEATAMAVDQCLRGVNNSNIEETSTLSILTTAMKEFVDVTCILKNQEACFMKDVEDVNILVKRRDDSRREATAERLQILKEKVATIPDLQKLLPPPMTNYCDICDRRVGWQGMVEHVLGKMHQENLKKKSK